MNCLETTRFSVEANPQVSSAFRVSYYTDQRLAMLGQYLKISAESHLGYVLVFSQS